MAPAKSTVTVMTRVGGPRADLFIYFVLDALDMTRMKAAMDVMHRGQRVIKAPHHIQKQDAPNVVITYGYIRI